MKINNDVIGYKGVFSNPFFMRFKISVIIIICSSVMTGYGQKTPSTPKASMKGKCYFYWGWNRSAYSRSDIHLHGNDFDFTVKNTVAKDRQSVFGVDPYFKLDQITIPQYNYRLGYYFNSKYSLSLGFDHMKYVVVQDQIAKVTGTIEDINSRYSGNYYNSDVRLTGDFLQFEHTDGLNYINAELNRMIQLYHYRKFDLRGMAAFGSGILMPRTRAVVLDRAVNDQWHLSGFGISVKTGLTLSYNNHFFIQSELKGGYINMPDIVIEANSSDRASQKFDFIQANIVFGYMFNLIKY